MPSRIVLVPSPLLASDSWSRVAAVLEDLGHDVAIATLEDGRAPLWRQHAVSAAAAVPQGPYVLVAHSGAGPLLPAIADAAGRAPDAAIFVDAGLPIDQTTRLEQISVDNPETAIALRKVLEQGGSYPSWSEEDLAPSVPDEDLRRNVLRGVRPRDEEFFTEPIPVPPSWQGVASGYVRMSSAYDVWARMAAGRGWPVERLGGGHFQILTEPVQVAGAIDEVLAGLLDVDSPRDPRLADLRFDHQGLIPAVVQQHDTGEVLMVAWMNPETLAETLDLGETVFWSRSRGERWHKGATSGNTQQVVEVVADCDGDVVLVRVDQGGDGVACHTGKRTCFHVPLSQR